MEVLVYAGPEVAGAELAGAEVAGAGVDDVVPGILRVTPAEAHSATAPLRAATAVG